MPSKNNRKVPRSMINLLKNIFKQKKLLMKTTSYTQVEYLANPSAHVVEVVKKLREREEQGLARLRKEMEVQ